ALVGAFSASGSSTQAAAPKRILLVTTTVGFRHAAVPLTEQVFRELAKSTGDFTIVSTTDSPDFPTAEYQATVDQRNARIPLSEAKDNNMPAPGGGGRGGAGGVPNATPEQQAAVTEMNTSVAALAGAVTSATAALNSAIYSSSADAAALKAKVDALIAAEAAVANARLQALTRIQSSPAKLTPEQTQALMQAAGRNGGAGAAGRGGAPAAAPAPAPLTPAQQALVSEMNDTVRPLTQAATTARAALNGAPYGPTASTADIAAKAAALGTAQLALANANAAAFARMQSGGDRLSADQAALVALGGGAGRGGGGAGRGADPTLAKITKVLQQYLSADALKNYDAVAFLSTTGELPIPDKDAFFKWIAEGHAFIGLHSATDTLHQTPEYIKMVGAEFAGHGAFHPKVPVVNMDPKSPINAGWGAAIPIDEEFYLFKSYDPKQVHVLLEMQEQPYTKEPGHYPVSWIKMYGKGRVFYTSLGHRDDVLLPDATIGDAEFKVRYNQAPVALAVQKHILGGVRWALGLTQSDVTPQAK
ncbi:MAG: ThuA domain-containing protein, partial [Acidobacteriota bacterium]